MTDSKAVQTADESSVPGSLAPLDLPEHRATDLSIHTLSRESSDEALRAWLDIYDGLAEEDVAAVEAIALNRRNFMGPHE